MYQFLNFFSETVFAGACTVTLLSMLVYSIKRNIPVNRTVLTKAINITLLASSIVDFVPFVLSCIKAFHDGENGRYDLLNRFFGPYWWAAWTMFFVWTLLPQVLWFRKARRSWFWLIVIIMVQLLFELMLFITQWELIALRESSWAIIPTISVVDYLKHLGSYLIIVSVLYFKLSKRKLFKPSTSRSSSIQ